MRRLYGVKTEDYVLNVAGDRDYIQFIANSRSGQFFFYSHDGKYMIKTQVSQRNLNGPSTDPQRTLNGPSTERRWTSLPIYLQPTTHPSIHHPLRTHPPIYLLRTHPPTEAHLPTKDATALQRGSNPSPPSLPSLPPALSLPPHSEHSERPTASNSSTMSSSVPQTTARGPFHRTGGAVRVCMCVCARAHARACVCMSGGGLESMTCPVVVWRA